MSEARGGNHSRTRAVSRRNREKALPQNSAEALRPHDPVRYPERLTPEMLPGYRAVVVKVVTDCWNKRGLRIPGMETEDAIQEGMLAMVAKCDQYDPRRGAVSTWIYQVVRSRISHLNTMANADFRQDYRRESICEARTRTLRDHTADRGPQAVDAGDESRQLLRPLLPFQRALLMDYYGWGYRSCDLVPQYGPSKQRVDQKVMRALEKLGLTERPERVGVCKRPVPRGIS